MGFPLASPEGQALLARNLQSIQGMQDVEALARIIHAEAAQEPMQGKLAVGAVIDNRRRSGRYGEGWKGVITRPGQFSAINDVTGYAKGQGANDLFWGQPSRDSLAAAQAVIQGRYKDPTGGATHYFNPNHADPKWARGKQFSPIGNHVFGNADAGMIEGQAGQDVAIGGDGGDYTLEEIEAELARRQQPEYTLEEIDAEIANRKNAEQTRVDVDHALKTLNAQDHNVDPGVVDSQVMTFANAAGDGLMGGFSDNVAAGMDVAADALLDFLGLAPDSEDGQQAVRGYQEHLARRRAIQDQQEEANPGTALAGKVTGGLTTAAGMAKGGATLIGRQSTVSGKVAAGAGEGAAYGSVYGAGEADGENVAEGAGEGAVGGAVLGGLLARGGISFERYLEKRALLKAAKTPQQMKELSQGLFEAASKSNIVYKPQSVDDMVLNLAADLADETIDREIHPKASRVLSRLFDLADRPATLKEMERFRKLATDAAFEAKPGSADQRLAQMIRDRLDDFSLDDVNMVAPDAGAKLQKEARTLWAQYRKDQTISEAVERAVRRAESTGSGGNVNNAIRQNLRSILDNKRLRSGFNKQEIAAIEKVVRGAPVDNLLRLAGKLSPSGNGLMLGLNLGGAATFGPGALAVGAIGQSAKSLADRGTTQRVKALAAIIRSGGKPPATQMRRLSGEERRALGNLVSGSIGEDVGEPVLEEVRGLVATGK